MTKGKNYNSIVFLTTLSVYLGLVLAGGAGAPQVLAQAALTRNFDVQIEAEIKDDLDNKPDADEEIKNLADSLGRYFDRVEYLAQDLRKLHSIEKFDLSSERFQVAKNLFKFCDTDGKPLGVGQVEEDISPIGNWWVVAATKDAIYRFEDWNKFSDCLPSGKVEQSNAKTSVIKISYDKTGGLKVELVIDKGSKQFAGHLAANFNRAFKIYKVREDEPIVKEISKNTSFKSENNQVFIVTRLPRGSIDTLPAVAKKAQR